MGLNTNISQLDTAQLAKRVIDATNDAVRTIPAENTSFAIELDADDGDTIATRGISSSTKSSLTSVSTGVVLAAFDCSGYKNFNLYTNTTATLVGAQVCTLQISPSDTDNVWISTSLTVTESTTSGTVVMGTALTNVVARRARVSIAAPITSGTFDLYLVVSG